MNNNQAISGTRTRRRWTRVSVSVAAALVVALGASSCAQRVSPGGPSGGSTASSLPSGRATGKSSNRPSSKPSASAVPSGRSTAGKKPTPAVRPHGNIKQHAKTHNVSYRKHVPLTGSAKFENGIAVSVTSVRSVTSKAVGPGQIGGPALALVIKIKNGSKDPLDLSTVTVDLHGAKGVPGILAAGSPYHPLTGSLASGDSAKGNYVFTIAKADRKPITVQVQYGNGQTVLQFSGNA